MIWMICHNSWKEERLQNVDIKYFYKLQKTWKSNKQFRKIHK